MRVKVWVTDRERDDLVSALPGSHCPAALVSKDIGKCKEKVKKFFYLTYSLAKVYFSFSVCPQKASRMS